MSRTTILAACLAAAAALPLDAARAVPITGGTTQVEVTNLFGLTPDLSGDAELVSADPLTVGFPITGGVFEEATEAFLIEHEGSGVTLTDGVASATAGNFLIDTAAGGVFGDVFDITGGEDIEDALLFNVGEITGGEYQLLISEAFGTGLAGIFGAPADALIGAEFGIATPAPELGGSTPIPLPPAALMLGAGMAAFGMFAARRRAAA